VEPRATNSIRDLENGYCDPLRKRRLDWLIDRWSVHIRRFLAHPAENAPHPDHHAACDEASKRLTEAWNHQAEGPEVIAGLYSAVARMRLTSSSEIIKRAEQVIRLIIAAYADPNRTFGEFKQHVQDPELADPLRDFTEACREELNSLRA
jgi:hypothetical protein